MFSQAFLMFAYSCFSLLAFAAAVCLEAKVDR
jgi:hypothetical protein